MTQISSSETSAVLCAACGPRVDTFATCAKDGTVRVWDLCDYAVVTELSERPRGGGVGSGSTLCICWLGEEAVITGWADSFVRYGEENEPLKKNKQEYSPVWQGSRIERSDSSLELGLRRSPLALPANVTTIFFVPVGFKTFV